MPTIFMFSRVEHEKSFITLGPGPNLGRGPIKIRAANPLIGKFVIVHNYVIFGH